MTNTKKNLEINKGIIYKAKDFLKLCKGGRIEGFAENVGRIVQLVYEGERQDLFRLLKKQI